MGKKVSKTGIWDNLFFWFVIFANMAGAAYGFAFYYWDRLASTSFPLIIFVPDCPLYVLLFAISAIIVKAGIRHWASDILIFISSAGLAKYAVWTMFVILFFNQYFLAPEVAWLYTALFVAHLLTLLETFAFVGRFDIRRLGTKFTVLCIAVAVVWLVLNDVSDYVLDTHPTLPVMDALQFSVLVLVTLALSLVIPFLYYLALRSRSVPVLDFIPKLVFG
ncbi:MAG: DUF1405 domain-containing protein [Candidatus Micrarchaeia archaeon]